MSSKIRDLKIILILNLITIFTSILFFIIFFINNIFVFFTFVLIVIAHTGFLVVGREFVKENYLSKLYGSLLCSFIAALIITANIEKIFTPGNIFLNWFAAFTTYFTVLFFCILIFLLLSGKSFDEFFTKKVSNNFMKKDDKKLR